MAQDGCLVTFIAGISLIGYIGVPGRRLHSSRWRQKGLEYCTGTFPWVPREFPREFPKEHALAARESLGCVFGFRNKDRAGWCRDAGGEGHVHRTSQLAGLVTLSNGQSQFLCVESDRRSQSTACYSNG